MKITIILSYFLLKHVYIALHFYIVCLCCLVEQLIIMKNQLLVFVFQN